MQNNIPSLEDVKSHFDHWRATRPKRCKIPSSLWDKVKPIIGHYSMTNITQALRELCTKVVYESSGGNSLIALISPFFRNAINEFHTVNHIS